MKSFQFTREEIIRHNLANVEEFVGGDAELRGRTLVVAGPQGAIHAVEGQWIVNRDGVFTVEDSEPKP